MATKPKFASKAQWKKVSDRGPHAATLPSGTIVEFIVPDSDELVMSGRLPSRLMEVAVMASANPDGPQGYVEDLASLAIRGSELAQNAAWEKLAEVFPQAAELKNWLVAHMVVSPTIEPDEVKELPKQDVVMLLDFAERKRNTDAAGVVLPIVVLEEFATFRDESAGGEADAARESDRGSVSVADPEADGVSV